MQPLERKDFTIDYAGAQGNKLSSLAASQGVNEGLPTDSIFVTNLIVNNLITIR